MNDGSNPLKNDEADGAPETVATVVIDPMPKLGLIAERQARLLPRAQLVASVVDVLGLKLTAYIVGVKDTRTIAAWSKPPGEFDLVSQRKLQGALGAIAILQERYEPESVATWFTFVTDALDDTSPATLLRKAGDDDVEDAVVRILAAARRDFAR